MNLNKLILGLFSVFLAVSCRQELKVTFQENADDIETYIESHKYTVIVYMNPEGCTTCHMSTLSPWKLYRKILDKYNIHVLLMVNSTNEEYITEILKSLELSFYLVFDKKGKFKIMNNEIFQIASDEVFVIDKDKNVIFTESLIKNDKTLNTFIKLVE
jgi:hypothetical protein